MWKVWVNQPEPCWGEKTKWGIWPQDDWREMKPSGRHVFGSVAEVYFL